jgi:glucose/arabinose dehydrogenase
MFLRILPLLTAFLLIGAALPVQAQPLQLVNAFPGLTFTRPVLVTSAGDGSNRVFVLQQNGLIRVFPNDSASASTTTFLNITAKLSSTSGEEGLLGLAFHPEYESNGTFFVNYTAPSPLRTVVSRFTVSAGNPNRADSLSEEVLLEFAQPYTNHNGGMLFFGNDGYLYISTGDGGSGGDPQNNSQNTNSLLGKILRIDVDTTGVSTAYGIPPGNPFAGGGGRAELFAWGLRNPWRASNDPVTGQIWAGDVGQGSWEEVNLIEAGGNYGWRCYEGNSPYDLSLCGIPQVFTFPVKVYSSQSPNPECSVTGGYVYRGQRRPELVGRYIYGDYCSGKIWKFLYAGGSITEDTILIDAPFSITGFGTDEQGELYICNYGSGTIHRFNGPALTSTTLASPVNGAADQVQPVQLRWRGTPGALAYRLEVDDDPAFTTPAVDDSTLGDTTAVCPPLDSAAVYSWRVRVRNAAGWGPASPVWTFHTAPPLPVDVPGLLSPPDGATNLGSAVTLTWSPLPEVRNYRVVVADDSLFSAVVLEDSLADTTVTAAGLPAGTTYFWRARGENVSGAGPWSAARRFATRLSVTVNITAADGWNLLSVPVDVDDWSTSAVFPGTSASVFSFDPAQGYLPRTTLAAGEGYWVKYDAATGVSVTGGPRSRDSIALAAGWNIVGPLTQAVDTADVATDPAGLLSSPFFGYAGAYAPEDSLRPGRGYWVKSGGEGLLILQLPVFRPLRRDLR